LCQKETGSVRALVRLEAGVGIEPASTALQVENASKPNKQLRNDSQKNSALRFLMISNNNAV